MINNKFINVFRVLGEAEIAAFYKYLKQRHDDDGTVLKVFEYMRKSCVSPKAAKKLELAYAYKALFHAELPDGDVERKKLLNPLSKLYLELKDFLLCEKIRSDALENQALWLGILQERGLNGEFSKQAVDFREATKAASKKNAKDYLRAILADYFHHYDLSLSGKTEDINVLQEYLDSLNLCAETIRCKIACEMITMIKMEPGMSGFQPPAVSLEWPVPKDAPMLLLYREVYQLANTGQEVHFDRLVSGLQEYGKDLDPTEIIVILKYMYNYTAQFVRNGDEITIAKKLHPFNKFAEQYDLFNQKGVMTPNGFTNIINVACAAEDVAWAAAFVEKHGSLMPKATVSLAKAVILFDQKEFNEVIRILENEPFRAVYDVLRVKLLALRSYYNLGKDIDWVLDYCGNFERWLRTHQDTLPDAVAGARAFLHLFKQLLLEETDKKTLLARIESTPNMYCRTWLRNQASRYKGRYAPRKRSK